MSSSLPPLPPEDDTGIPVNALNEFEEDVSTSFIPRLRRRIHRRALTNQVVSFSYDVPALLLREFLALAGSWLEPTKGNRP
jgi:hypothetical protein